MAYIVMPLFFILTISLLSLYFGIWGSVLDAFSNERLRNDLLVASRLTEYEQARLPHQGEKSALIFFKQTEKLSERQKEVFRDILNETNKRLFLKFLLLLFFIGWGTIFISHKIAGPLYRFHHALETIEEGNFRFRIHLRKGDEAKPLAKRFNQTLEYLDHIFSRLKNIVRENEDNPDRLKARLKEELSRYKTSADH